MHSLAKLLSSVILRSVKLDKRSQLTFVFALLTG